MAASVLKLASIIEVWVDVNEIMLPNEIIAADIFCKGPVDTPSLPVNAQVYTTKSMCLLLLFPRVLRGFRGAWMEARCCAHRAANASLLLMGSSTGLRTWHRLRIMHYLQV